MLLLVTGVQKPFYGYILNNKDFLLDDPQLSVRRNSWQLYRRFRLFGLPKFIFDQLDFSRFAIQNNNVITMFYANWSQTMIVCFVVICLFFFEIFINHCIPALSYRTLCVCTVFRSDNNRRHNPTRSYVPAASLEHDGCSRGRRDDKIYAILPVAVCEFYNPLYTVCIK